MSREHPLFTLENKEVNNYQIHVNDVSKGRFAEEINFKIYLKNAEGGLSQNPIMDGKYFAGRGKFYRPWIEVYFINIAKFESHEEPLSFVTLELLFKMISTLLPVGGKLMVPYINHGPTDIALRKGVPPVTTLIGYLMFQAGCTWFKDWYFAEGSWEGDVKLQGNKPFDEDHRKKNLHSIYKDVSAFLDTEKTEDEVVIDCRNRAKLILEEIKKQFPDI